MSRGTFVISLDTELAWGWVSRPERVEFYPLYERTREVIARLLALFERYRTPATWALVGRLFERQDGPHPRALHAPSYPQLAYDELYADAHLNRSGNSFLRGDDIVAAILASRVAHEIASHSYNHIVFADNTCTAELAAADIAAAREVAHEWGVTLRTFVYPRNHVGHQDTLAAHGFRAFRSSDVHWFDGWPLGLRLLLRRFDLALAVTPSVSRPGVAANGLVSVPGHLFFRVPHRGVEKHFPLSRLVTKAKKGLRRAAAERQVFQLWFHPFNFAYRMDQHLAGLEEILRAAALLRDAGRLDIVTLGDCAERATRSPARVGVTA